MRKTQQGSAQNYRQMKKKRNIHIEIPSDDQQYQLPSYLQNQSLVETFQPMIQPLELDLDNKNRCYQEPLNQRQSEYQYISSTKQVQSESQQNQSPSYLNGRIVNSGTIQNENSYANKIKSLTSPKVEVLKTLPQQSCIKVNNDIANDGQISSKNKDKKSLHILLENLKKKRSSYLTADLDLPSLTLEQIRNELIAARDKIESLKKKRKKLNFTFDNRLLRQQSNQHIYSYIQPKSKKSFYHLHNQKQKEVKQYNYKIASTMLNAK